MGDQDQEMNDQWREMVETMFTLHTLTYDQLQRQEAIRTKAKELALLILDSTPPSTDQEDAIRKIRMAVMLANQAIACWHDSE